jgi:hypothetical protein
MAQNFSMSEGDTKVLECTLLDGDGAIVDLTGASIRWKLARSVHAPALISKATSDGGVEIVAPASLGRFNVLLAPTDTEGKPGTYYHEAEVIGSDGAIETVLTGTATLTPTLIKP